MIAMPVEPPALALTRLPPVRRAVVEELAAEIVEGDVIGRRLVAVDGLGGTDAAAFADDLALALRARGTTVFRASLDGFRRPRTADARPGEPALSTDSDDTVGLRTLRRVLLDPFRMAGSTGFQLSAFDAERDAPAPSAWTTGPADAVLVLDGDGLDRPELRDDWTLAIEVRDPDAPRRRRPASGSAP